MNIQIHFKEENLRQRSYILLKKKKEKRKKGKEKVQCSFKVNIHHKIAAKLGRIIYVY